MKVGVNGGENGLSEAITRCRPRLNLSLRPNKRSVFSRTCAGKRHLKSRERGDRKGANGGKREGERSERESVVPRPPERGG